MSSKTVDFDAFWKTARYADPEQGSLFPILSPYFSSAKAVLEIGPGTRPRVPVAGSYFLDSSPNAIRLLNKLGGIGTVFDASQRLPYANNFFDVVCAFEVLEHFPDDRKVSTEIYRVVKSGGLFIFSVPAGSHHWTAFDAFGGHYRRYDSESIHAMLSGIDLLPESVFLFSSQWFSWFVRFPVTKKLAAMLMLLIKKSPEPFFFLQDKFLRSLDGLHIVKPRKLNGTLAEIPDSTLRLLIVCRKKG